MEKNPVFAVAERDCVGLIITRKPHKVQRLKINPEKDLLSTRRWQGGLNVLHASNLLI